MDRRTWQAIVHGVAKSQDTTEQARTHVMYTAHTASLFCGIVLSQTHLLQSLPPQYLNVFPLKIQT